MIQWLLDLLDRADRPHHSINRPHHSINAKRFVKPAVEELEQRCLLATYGWTGAAKNDMSWSNPANWDLLRAPGPNDNAVFDIGVQGFKQPHAIVDKPNIKIQGLDVSSDELTIPIFSSVLVTSKFFQAGGTIDGPGNLVLNCQSQWIGGTMSGTGKTAIIGAPLIGTFFGSLLINGGVTLDNRTLWIVNGFSVVDWLGGNITTKHGAYIANDGRFLAERGGTIGPPQGEQGGYFSNRKLFVKEGAGTSTINAGFSNSGIVRVEQGSLYLGGGGINPSSSTFNVAKGTSIFLVNTTPGFYWEGNTSLIGSGTVWLSGDLAVPMSSQVSVGLDGSKTKFVFLAGNLITYGRVEIGTGATLNWISGSVTGSGTLNIDNGATANIGLILTAPVLKQAILNNSGTLNLLASTLWIGSGAVLNNVGTFNVMGDALSAIKRGAGAAKIINTGTFQKDLGGGTTDILVPFENYNLLLEHSGKMNIPNLKQFKGITQIDAGAAIQVKCPFDIEGGILKGYGKVIGDVLNAAGTIYPGDVNTVGTLTVTGRLIEKSTGKIYFDISGTTSDQLNVGGQAILNGTLYLNYLGGIIPIGTVFSMMPYASHVGDFPVVSGWLFTFTRFWPDYTSTGLAVDYVNGTSGPGTPTGISPTSGYTAGGTSVTITGTSFIDSNGVPTVWDVNFGGVPANSFTVNSATSITAMSPSQASGSVSVGLNGAGGLSFTVNLSPAPVVTGIVAASGSTGGGTLVTITGSNFTGATGVSFGRTAALCFTVNSDTQITAMSPAGSAGTVDVTVTTYSGTSATGSADQFTYLGPPTVTGLSTTSGPSAGGTVLTVTGTNFSGATEVDFGTVPATQFTVNSNTLLTVVAPAEAAGTYDVTVSNSSGTSPTVAADQFSYTVASAPAVTGLSTASGTTGGGTVVVLTGTGFTSATGVSFGAVPATSFWVYADSAVIATAPPQAAGTYDITVTTPAGTSAVVTADHFTYNAASAPAVTAITPTSGSTAGGTIVTITGSGFTGATGVSFGSVAAASFTVYSDTSIVATTPSQATGTVHTTVTTYSGSSSTSTADQFTYSAASAPSVSSISPTSGSTAGGTIVAIFGSNFTGATAVSFGTLAASSFAVLADNQISATAPAQAAGTFHITVTTPSGTSSTSTSDQFTYSTAAVPTVTSLSTTSGSTSGGTVLTITGSGFTGATAVTFGSAPASTFTVNSDTLITVVTPPDNAGIWDVTVTAPGGTSALASGDRFTYSLASVPAVTGLSVTSGSTAGGTLVLITGTTFTGASSVSFGTTPATSFTVNSDTSITATAPPQAAATVDITVTTPSGTSAVATADQFAYSAAAAPAVTAITPTSGSTAGGAVVTITGTGFTGATGVSFGTVAATFFQVYSDTTIVATAPPQAAATVHTTVTTPSGTSATGTADQFTYAAAAVPSVSGITPTSGTTPGGTLVTVTGSGFTGATGVTFGSVAASWFTVYSDSTIVATSPPEAASTVDIKVTTYSGTSSTSTADQFTYNNVTAPAPAVTGVSPNSGSTAGGWVVTITGTNFSGATAVNFGSTAATSFTINSDTQITATAPAESAATVDIKVTTNNGTSSAVTADQFTYLSTPAPAVTSISPTTGTTAGGTSVTITGTNFTGATAVSFGAFAASSFTVNSSTSITATSPAQAVRVVDITITTPSGISATGAGDQFTYTAASVPTVTSLGTTSGSTAGGTSVTITGTNFTGATGVYFGSVAASSFTVNSATSITATSPAQAAGTYDVTVSTYSGTSARSTSDRFSYTLASTPAITSISPTSGSTAGGTSVTLTGTNFTGATGVFFGTVAATSFTVNSSTSITATAPPEAAATVDITVTTYAGSSAVGTGDRFTFNAAAAPSVTSISPTSGNTGGGTVLTITGSGFTGATAVTFGSAPASTFTVNSDTSITATTPPQAAGTVHTTVTTYGGTSSTSTNDQFTYNAVTPSVTGITPSSGSTAGGAVVTVLGSGFTGASAVSFGSTVATSFTVYSDTAIITTAPPGTAGTVDITVTAPGGTSTTGTADRYTYSAASVPSVTSLGTTSGSTGGGTVVTISGSGFTGASAVAFGGVGATAFTINSDTLITVVAPPSSAGVWDVTVTGPAGTSTFATGDRFTYSAASAPAVTSLSTTSGSTAGGTALTITGSGFTGASGVSFGATAAAAFTVISDTQIVATAPPQAAGVVNVSVTSPTGTSAVVTADQFTYSAAATPAVTSITPTSGTTAGGTPVTITGSGFTGASGVSFGSTAAGFTVYSDSTIVATAPPQAAGTVDITVTTPSGTSAAVSADRFTYSAATAPAVKGITPTSGTTAGGTSVTVSGTGFTGATAVNFAGTAATSFTVSSDTLLTAIAPAGSAGTWHVTVTTPGGTSATSTADQFTYSAIAAPSVTAISPTSGSTAGGTVVTITGTAFTGTSAVYFGTTAAASFTANSDTLITAMAPPQAAGTVDILVTTANGTSSAVSADHFTYTAAAAPSVTAVSPTSGSTGGGTVVTVTGSGFTSATAVTFGTVPATTFTVNSDTSLTATAPAETAATIDVTVTTPSGTSATGSADHFTYNAAAAPSVTSITPTSGSTAGGTVVTIFGTNLSGATGVSFGSTAGTIIAVYSSSAVIASTPAEAAGTVHTTVTTYSGTSSTSTADQFTFVSTPAPAITSISPTSGPDTGGTSVTITCTNFTGATGLSFGTVLASFTVNSATQITATSPLHAMGTVDIMVTTPSGTSATSTADQFTFNQTAPTVTAVSPTSGRSSGGTTVTITGTDFTGATAVKFGTTAATSFTVNSNTQITATSPSHSLGTVDITVTTSYGTSATSSADHFTYTFGLFASGSGAPAPTDFSAASTVPAGGLSGVNVELYVDNTNGDLTSDELARIADAVAAIDTTVAPYGVTITEVSDPTLANFTLLMDTTSVLGGYADGVLACTADVVTIIQGWDWYADADSTQIGPSQFDFQTAVTHELGHTLGLGHNPDPTSVMYPMLAPGQVNRVLTTADLNFPDTEPGPGALHAAVPAHGATLPAGVPVSQMPPFNLLMTASPSVSVTPGTASLLPGYGLFDVITDRPSGTAQWLPRLGVWAEMVPHSGTTDDGADSPPADDMSSLDGPYAELLDRLFQEELISPQERDILPGDGEIQGFVNRPATPLADSRGEGTSGVSQSEDSDGNGLAPAQLLPAAALDCLAQRDPPWADVCSSERVAVVVGQDNDSSREKPDAASDVQTAVGELAVALFGASAFTLPRRAESRRRSAASRG